MLHNVMKKILIIFFMFISTPLYSDEFNYHCEEGDFSIVYKVDPKQKTVVHLYSIFKTKGEVRDVNKDMEIYHWDEENNSVWILQYKDLKFSSPAVTMILLNFEYQKMVLQFMVNNTTKSGTMDKWSDLQQYSLYHCYTLE
ncbi:hypothetical protein N8367_00990 [Amylibacter sp.]|nr:hypothetical protein [Amylibacter sp.]